MPGTYIQVPYAEKDEVKKLGARWSAKQQRWFIPEHLNLDAFARWLPKKQKMTVWADYYYIATTATYCWKCGWGTPVYGIYLPPGRHRILDGDGESWFKPPLAAFVYFMEHATAQASARLAAISAHYRIDYSGTTKSSYWMNHCHKCQMKQGDFGLFCEPGGAFYPTTTEEGSLISYKKVAEPFGCDGGTSYHDGEFTAP